MTTYHTERPYETWTTADLGMYLVDRLDLFSARKRQHGYTAALVQHDQALARHGVPQRFDEATLVVLCTDETYQTIDVAGMHLVPFVDDIMSYYNGGDPSGDPATLVAAYLHVNGAVVAHHDGRGWYLVR